MKNVITLCIIFLIGILGKIHCAEKDGFIKRLYSTGAEAGFGYTQGSFDMNSYNFLNPTFFFNAILYENYDSRIGSFLAKSENPKNQIVRNLMLKIPVEYINTHIQTSDFGAGVWGLSTGLAFQTGYAYKIKEKRSLDFLNNYGIGTSLIFVGDIDNKNDDFESSPNFNIVQSIDHFTFYDQTESRITFRNNRSRFNISYQQRLNHKDVIVPTWLINRVIDLGLNELIELYLVKIFKENEELLPICNFILKTSIYYFIADIRSSNNNWPFQGKSAFVTRTLYFSISGYSKEK